MMKKHLLLFMVIFSILQFSCGKNAEVKSDTANQYQPDSIGTAILQKVAARIPVMDPNNTVVLVKTDDFELTNRDIFGIFLRSLQLQPVDLDQIPDENIKSVIANMAEQETERRLLYQEAVNRGLQPTAEELDKTMQEIFMSYGGQEDFEGVLNEAGFTMDMVREDQENSLAIQNLIDDLTKSVSREISEEEIQKAMSEDKTATVRHILFLTQGKSAEEKSTILKKAEKVMARAKSGEDFSALVKEYSEDPGSKDNGGLYADFPRGRMVPEFENASFNLPVGSISDIVETSYGYHIIKVESRNKDNRSREEIIEELSSDQDMDRKNDIFMAELQRLKDEKHFKMLFEADAQ